MFQRANSARLLVFHLQLNLFQGVFFSWMSHNIIITKKRLKQTQPSFEGPTREWFNLKPWWIHQKNRLRKQIEPDFLTFGLLNDGIDGILIKWFYDIIPTTNWVVAENSQIYAFFHWNQICYKCWTKELQIAFGYVSLLFIPVPIHLQQII